ncbi:MAG TPA: hypothetical protein VKU02_21120 [Gemmataceae bacterium]|nr:hypothetical protein [Gemmataceae bacterium]
MFSQPAIEQLLNQYTLVELYTDVVPPQHQPTTSADENRDFLSRRFGTAQLPLYVILKPLGDGRYEELGRYDEGKINKTAAFAEFLRQYLAPRGEITHAKVVGG